MKYKLIIFDFDGTLANTFPWVLGIMDQLADKFKFAPLTSAEVENLRGNGAGKVLKDRRVPFWKFPLIARYVRQLMAQEIDQIQLFPGVGQLLTQLTGAGVRLAMVTTNARANVCRVLGAENYALFEDLECGVSIFGKQGKYRRVLRRCGIPAGEALCIGDELRDLDAARKAGIPFGAVTWGYTRIEALQAQAHAEVFSSLDQIAQAFSNIPIDKRSSQIYNANIFAFQSYLN
jgi:phosphoglycolate phosphatase